jgi:hypothetical protein
MWQVCGRKEIHTTFWRESLKERHYFKNLGIDGTVLLEKYVKERQGGRGHELDSG